MVWELVWTALASSIESEVIERKRSYLIATR